MDHGFRAYQPRSVRRQHERISLTMGPSASLRLTAAAVSALGASTYVRLDFNPETQTIAIRPTTADDVEHRVKLCRDELKNGDVAGHVSARGFLVGFKIPYARANLINGYEQDGILFFPLKDHASHPTQPPVQHPVGAAHGR